MKPAKTLPRPGCSVLMLPTSERYNLAKGQERQLAMHVSSCPQNEGPRKGRLCGFKRLQGHCSDFRRTLPGRPLRHQPLRWPRRRQDGCARLAAAGLLILTLFLVPLMPTAALAADIFEGKKIYEKHCASCHGVDGRPSLPGTPDFQRGEGLFASDATLMQSLKTGKGTMPGYDHIISNKDILNALAYSRTLQQ